LLNKLKKLVMAFRAGKEIKPKHIESTLDLTKEEISVLLQLIKVSNFSGDMVESVYNIVYKLQVSSNNIK
jgi:hypothetical protein|tara:strand:+ start:1659 stop:1868 length:210 start_codon:yes stop_codon:yes gene_type:complete